MRIEWSSLWKKEDWWAVWVGLGIVAVALIAFFIGKYQAKVNDDKLNDLYTKIDHTKNYK